MNTTVTPDTQVTFYRFRRDGTPNPDIKRCFLHPVTLTAEDAISGHLTLTDDGSLWTLVLEQAVRDELKQKAEVFCICSFQVRRNGAYCVARLNKNPPEYYTKTIEEKEQKLASKFNSNTNTERKGS